MTTNTTNVMTKAEFTGDVFVTPHAIDKAMQLFPLETAEEARRFVKNGLANATFISEIVGETGKVDRLYAHRRIAFVLDRVDDVVITVYIRDNVDRELRDKVRDLLSEHIKDLFKQERTLYDELLSLEMENDILQELHKREVFGDMAEEIEMSWNGITRKQNEIDAFKLERSKIAKGAVAFL
jgi:hypothetical protein